MPYQVGHLDMWVQQRQHSSGKVLREYLSGRYVDLSCEVGICKVTAHDRPHFMKEWDGHSVRDLSRFQVRCKVGTNRCRGRGSAASLAHKLGSRNHQRKKREEVDTRHWHRVEQEATGGDVRSTANGTKSNVASTEALRCCGKSYAPAQLTPCATRTASGTMQC